MPRILVAGFCAIPGPDRAGVQLGHVIRALARHHTVDVLSVRRGDQAYVERMGNARLLRVPVPDGTVRSRVEAFRRALKRQLDGADYDVVHFRDGWSGIPVLEAQGRLKFAAVFDAGRSPLAEAPAYDHETISILEREETECLRRADLVLAATEAGRQHMAELIPAERVRLVPPGVDVDAFDWDEPAPGPPRILYAGALTPGRGVRVLLRAMLEVAAETDARLTLAGRASAEFFESLENAVRDLNLRERVQLLGEVAHEDVPALMASATICVSPGAVDSAARETALYPTKLLEYMACQRAVVAPRRGTVTMPVRDEQHALLFEPGQPLDLAQKLILLLRDAELRSRIARAGYELVRRAHTASGTRRELRRAYAWLSSIDPWRERFTAFLDDMRTGDMPPIAPAGESDAWMHARAAAGGDRSIAAFGGDVPVDELTENPVDTGLIEGGEVTKVEANPLTSDEDRPAPAYQPLAAAVASAPDDWVVDDFRARHPAADRPADRAPPVVDARFVAGEVEVPSGGRFDPVGALRDEAFAAIGPPLGFTTGEIDQAGIDATATSPMPRVGDEVDIATGQTTALNAVPPPPMPPLRPIFPSRGERGARVARPSSEPTITASRPPEPEPPEPEPPEPEPPEPEPPKAPSVVVGPEVRVGTGEDTGP